MKFKKTLLIIGAVIFFLTALTFYINRVVFPQLIKKAAIERLQETLKRKVEIGSIRFNWVKGFIIDKVKIYEKDPATVFAQADQVSFGVLFFPGLKHYRITIPFINVKSPSVHLVRTAQDTWNFSDMFTSPPATAAPADKAAQPSAFEIAWGGITISDGKFLVEDNSTLKPWSEFLDSINLKLSLSYKGINYTFTADIPGKKGFVGATVYYQPLTKDTQAQIHLKNIDTASYLSLIDIPDMHLNSGIITEINLNINYTQDKTSAQGDVLIKNLDVISSQEQSFKGDIEIRGLDAQYQNGDITGHGQMTLSHMETRIPGLAAGGSIEARVNDFVWSKEKAAFSGSVHAQDIFVDLKDRRVKAAGVSLDNIRIKKDNDGIQSTGSIDGQGLLVQWPSQEFQGDISIKDTSLRMKDENDIQLRGQLSADHFSTSIDGKTFTGRHMLLADANLAILGGPRRISLKTKLSIDGMTLGGEHWQLSALLKTDKLLFNLNDDTVNVSSTLDFTQGRMVLDHHQTIKADPQVELALEIPLKTPEKMTYKGSITLSDGSLQGFSPVKSLDGIELDVDFQNDEATINALSANILDTNVRASGTIKDFKHPFLNILAEAQDLNLSKISELAPQLTAPYGLTFDGTSFVKVKFEGLASDPLAGKILAVASVKNVNAASSKFHQHLKNITGVIEATPDSLKWRDFTVLYQDKKYQLAGSIENFKNPRVLASINGPDLQMKTDIIKDNSRMTIHSLTGKYLNASFDSQGTIDLSNGQAPVFDINNNISFLLEDMVKALPAQARKSIEALKPAGTVNIRADLKGSTADWKNDALNVTVTSPVISLAGYKLTAMKISAAQAEGKVKNLTLDGKLYDGTVHGVGSMDLEARGMPYDAALNIDGTDMHKLKMDSPLKMEEIDGKFYFTSVAHGTVADFKNSLHATGSMAIRDGFLAEFNLFKGLLGVLNDALRLGQVEITDVESNFTLDNQKINTDNLRLKGPTIVLLGRGWVNFDQYCDLNITVDLSSGVVPAIANDVLNTLNIRIYDRIDNPKFKKKISVPQVINSLFKNLLQ